MKKDHSFLVYFIVFVLAVFIVFFAASKFFGGEKMETTEYNFFEFVKIDNIWYTEWQKDNKIYTVSMRHNPHEVEDLPIVGNLSSSFNRQEVYVSFHPTEGNFTVLSLAAGELSLNMFRALGVKPIAACLINNTEVCSDRPIVTCEDEGKSVITIIDKGDPGIALRGECIRLQGEGMDLLKSVDRLLYQWYGIMK